MAINLFSDYGGFYNSYKVTDIPKVDVEAVKKQDEIKAYIEPFRETGEKGNQ